MLGPQRSSAEALDGLSIVLLRCLAVAEKRLTSGENALAPVSFAPLGAVSEALEALDRKCIVTSPDRRLDYLWERPRSDEGFRASPRWPVGRMTGPVRSEPAC